MEVHTLWQAIAETRIEPADATLTFGRRLAQENGWSEAHAARVEAEYRRFLYLMAVSDRELTPSDAVDQAWHLHLAYTRHYWDELCGRILGRPLHHGPTAGGPAQRERYRDQYADTLAAYAERFGEAPPADIWPPPARRFATRSRRIDADEWLLIRKRPALLGAIVVSALSLAACARTAQPIASGALIAVVMLLVFWGFSLARQAAVAKKRREDGCGGDVSLDFGGAGDCDGGSDGGCGGCGGCS